MSRSLKLMMNSPIKVHKNSNVHVYHPTVSQMVELGEEIYKKYVSAYAITTSSVFDGIENEEELIRNYKIFDLFFLKVKEGETLLDGMFGESAVEFLRKSLEFFLRTDDIKILPNRMRILVGDDYIIDREEFDNLRLIIQSVTGSKDIEVEKPPKNMTKRKLDIWLKLKKGRERASSKNAINTETIINYISFGGKSYISYEEIGKMTMYQMYNAYKSIMGVDAYDVGMLYKLSQKYDIKDDIKHWTESLKIED